MSTNLMPAIVIAGPPHSGKSVLAFELGRRLQQMGIAHYVLQAVPDGEGRWFMESGPQAGAELRRQAKTEFSSGYVRHMLQVIDGRPAPFLVDSGGAPRGDQFQILRACTHSVLLYRQPQELEPWRAQLAALNLQPVAELQSTLTQQEAITQSAPLLQGLIAGLERQPEARRFGACFEALLQLTAGICHYEAHLLEPLHLAQAPYPALLERELAARLQPPLEGAWLPERLAEAAAMVQQGQSLALYGRGPVWLAAALALRAWPRMAAVFDLRYGWVRLPSLRVGSSAELRAELGSWGQAELLEISLPLGWLSKGPLRLPDLQGRGGLVLSGRLPRWAFAALARGVFRQRSWIAVRDARLADQAVVVHSNSPVIQTGDLLHRS
jgi:CRISPR-associated protein Csx3